jgi:hypothetical protein
MSSAQPLAAASLPGMWAAVAMPGAHGGQLGPGRGAPVGSALIGSAVAGRVPPRVVGTAGAVAGVTEGVVMFDRLMAAVDNTTGHGTHGATGAASRDTVADIASEPDLGDFARGGAVAVGPVVAVSAPGGGARWRALGQVPELVGDDIADDTAEPAAVAGREPTVLLPFVTRGQRRRGGDSHDGHVREGWSR